VEYEFSEVRIAPVLAEEAKRLGHGTSAANVYDYTEWERTRMLTALTGVELLRQGGNSTTPARKSMRSGGNKF
jgi:cell division GTPase FtsZ